MSYRLDGTTEPRHAPTLSVPRLTRRRVLRSALGITAVAVGADLFQPSRHQLVFADDGGPGNPGTVVVAWNEVALQAIRATHPTPPVAARALAILHTCMYDAWAAYTPVALGTRLGGVLRRPVSEHTATNKTEAVSHAAYSALKDVFPTEKYLFTALMTSLGYDPSALTTDTRMPSGIGAVVARAVLDFRHGDGANQLGDLHPVPYSDYTGYRPVNDPDHIRDPNRWQPLRVDDGRGGTVVQHCTTPHWGLVIPFALASGAQLRPALGPARYPSNRYRRQAMQILEYSARLTDAQKVIVEYWADGPGSELPPGHWCLFGHFVCRRDHHDLDADIQLFLPRTAYPRTGRMPYAPTPRSCFLFHRHPYWQCYLTNVTPLLS